MRAAVAILTCAAAVVAVTLPAGCGSEERTSAAPRTPRAERALRGAPRPLATLHEQANRLLDGGADAFRERLAGLRGHPVVVNKWASWCGPCRAEFPFFQRLSVELGTKIAFIGVNALDNNDDAEEFLREFPVSYPSYRDPNQEIAKVFEGNAGFPTTAFYDRRGELVIAKQGGYSSEEKLRQDIQRYAK